MNPGTIEVRFLPGAQRAVSIAATAAAGAFMLWLAVTAPHGGAEIGYVIGGLCVWAALGFLLVPRVVAKADAGGFEIVELRLAPFFVYPRCRATWQDVLGVETVVRKARYGSYLETRLHVRTTDDPARARVLSVSSRSPGYPAFVARLKEQVGLAPIPAAGPGGSAARWRAPAAHRLGLQLAAAAGLAFALALMVLAIRNARH